MSTPHETYRATMQVQTPEHGKATLIVTRQGRGRAARTWLTLHGDIAPPRCWTTSSSAS